jgi:hypothetical protein
MRRLNLLLIPLLLTPWYGCMVASLAVAGEAPGPARYWAMWRDGTTQSAPRMEGQWWEDGATLAGRRLHEPDKGLRLISHLDLKPSTPSVYVQMANGDVLPGRVSQCLPAMPDGDLPARVLVSPEAPILTSEGAGVWVRADAIARIVAARTDASAREPGTLILADGRVVSANMVRWAEQGVRALTDAGIVNIALGELADVHLPRVDRVAAVIDDAVFPPLPKERVIARLETAEGAALTWRRAMTFVSQEPVGRAARGKPPETRTFLHIQPGWALGPLMVPADTIANVGFRHLDEVPLGHLPAEVLEQQTGIHAWPWQRNRSVRGETLRSGQAMADLGLGTHSHVQLAFELPPGARQFSTRVGIDNSVSSGGCAEVKVFADRPSGQPLFASGHLRGGKEPIRIGPLDISQAKRLVLVTDMAHRDRPADAYPFDIGDHVNWLLPIVACEAPAVDRSALVRRFVGGWERWTMDETVGTRIDVAPRWDEAAEQWAIEVSLPERGTIELTRRIAMQSMTSDVLEVVVSPDLASLAERIEVRVDGERQELASERLHSSSGRRERAVREKRRQDGQAPPPDFRGAVLRWDLHAFAGRDAELSLRISAGPEVERIAWHALRFVAAVDMPADGALPEPGVRLTSLQPIDAKGAEHGKPQANRLPRAGRDKDLPIRFRSRQFDDGYGLTGKSSVTFAVEPNYKRFVALAGGCSDRPCPLQVLLDEEPVWQSGPLDENVPAKPLSLDIPPGTKTLTLQLPASSSGYLSGAFANAGFVTE